MEWICERCDKEFDDSINGQGCVYDKLADAAYCQDCADALEAQGLSMMDDCEEEE